VSAASKNWAGEPAESVEESRLSVRRERGETVFGEARGCQHGVELGYIRGPREYSLAVWTEVMVYLLLLHPVWSWSYWETCLYTPGNSSRCGRLVNA
jgi:hypothetical protein